MSPNRIDQNVFGQTIRRLNRRGLTAAIAIAGFALAAVPQANAASIGINFEGSDGTSGISLLATDSAGVVPQQNWNNLANHNVSISAGSLVDDTGAATTVSATLYKAGGTTWHSSNSFTAGSGDNKLMTGGLESYAMSTYPSQVQNLTGITYGDYDVYVYVNAGNDNVTDGASVNLAISGTGTGGGTILYEPMNNPGSYVAATNDASAAADYIVFHITGSSSTDTLTIKQGFALDSDKQVGLNAMQIVSDSTSNAPEPASLGLLSVGALGLLVRRRRHVNA